MKHLLLKQRTMNLLLFVLLVLPSLSAQEYQQTTSGFKTRLQSMDMEVKFYSPGIVRILKTPVGVVFKKESLSVIKIPENIQLSINKLGDVVTLRSNKLEVLANIKTGKVTYTDLNGVVLFTEKEYGTQFTPAFDGQRNSFIVRQAFMLDEEEAIYGMGQQQNGKLNQRGQRNEMQNANTKVCIPFFQSVKGYGVFWDNYASTLFTDNLQETSFESLGDCSDYYFMYGGNADGVIAQMRDLTGQVPMLPLWAYGYFQSRERYKTQEEIVGVVEKYRDLKVPLDGIIQDWQYWGPDSLWNCMSFDKKTFPDPKGMVDRIHKLNAHLMIVAWPGFAPATKQFKEFTKKKMLINFDTWPPNAGTKPYDPYNPEARDIYWDYLNKGVFSFNTDAWWLDSSEPDHINVQEKDFDQPTFLGSFRSVINAFPLEHVKGIYEHQWATTSDKRVVILTRSAFAGQQRYGANTWSGDIVSSWETLQKQIPAGLSFSLSANPYWNADIGGFFLWNFNKSNPLKNCLYRELYVRWIQFGVFTPMMRSHGTDAPREIYQFGNRGETEFDAIEKAICLRYSLLPYIYSTAREVNHHSGSIMRALFMDFAADKNTHDITDEYLFGNSILVAPVIDPMYASNVDTKDYSQVKTKPVYLPKGSGWIDFWTGEKQVGGQTVQKATPIDIIPLYIKAGSIIPWGPKVQYAAEKKWDNLEIRVYPGANGEFTLYEDENDNYNYEKGMNSTITMKWDDQSKTLTIGDRKGSFNGMLKSRTFNIIFVSQQNGTGVNQVLRFTKTVHYNGKAKSIKL